MVKLDKETLYRVLPSYPMREQDVDNYLGGRCVECYVSLDGIDRPGHAYRHWGERFFQSSPSLAARVRHALITDDLGELKGVS